MTHEYKFRALDIVSVVTGGRYMPIVILGEHTYPDGTPAYRMRYAIPQYDMEDSSLEFWDRSDGYLNAAWVDSNCAVVWRQYE